MESDLQTSRVATYKTPDGAIAFVHNSRDYGGYDVVVRGNNFYISDSQMLDATTPGVSTDRMIQMLDGVTDNNATRVLTQEGISPTDLHIALLHLRIIDVVLSRERASCSSRGLRGLFSGEL